MEYFIDDFNYFIINKQYINDIELYLKYIENTKINLKYRSYCIHDLNLKLQKLLRITNYFKRRLDTHYIKNDITYLQKYTEYKHILEYNQRNYIYRLSKSIKDISDKTNKYDHIIFKYYRCNLTLPKMSLNKSEIRILDIITKHVKRYKNRLVQPQKYLNIRYKSRLIVDFDIYLDAINKNNRIIIEFDGLGHKIGTRFFKPENIIKDNKKNEYCKKKNISMIRINCYEFLDQKLGIIFHNIYHKKIVYFIDKPNNIFQIKKENIYENLVI